MKKIFFIIIFVFALISLTACNNDGFVAKKYLREADLKDMIRPTHTQDFTEESLGYTYFNSTEEEFHKYANEVYLYLKNKEFKYFGYILIKEHAIVGSKCEFSYSTCINDHYFVEDHYLGSNLGTIEDDILIYEFVFSNKLDGRRLDDDVIVRLKYRISGFLDNNCNTSLEVRTDSNLMVVVYLSE